MTLQLSKPLVILDLETTGLRADKDRIWQIGIIKVYPDGHEKEWEQIIDPQIAVTEWQHDLKRPADFTGKPTFKEVSAIIYTGLKDVDYAGFNLSFDLGFLEAEFSRLGIEFHTDNVKVADAFSLFKMKHPRTLAAAVEEYLTEQEAAEYRAGAHTALVDSRATYRVLKAQLERWPDLPRTIDELHTLAFESEGYIDMDRKLKWNDSGEVIIAFGKNSGTPLRQCERRFLEWILRRDFSSKVKGIVQDALNGIYLEKKA